jgi:hypothetical protein
MHYRGRGRDRKGKREEGREGRKGNELKGHQGLLHRNLTFMSTTAEECLALQWFSNLRFPLITLLQMGHWYFWDLIIT